MTATSSQEIKAIVRRGAWNPVTQLRLLRWTFLTPAKLQNYHTPANFSSVKRVAAGLASLLGWAAIILPLLGMTLVNAPGRSPFGLPITLWLGAALLVWLVADRWVTRTTASVVAALVSMGLAVGLAVGIGVAGNLPVILIFGIAAGIVIGVAGEQALMVDFLRGLAVAAVAGLILGELGGLVAAVVVYALALAQGIVVGALLDINLATGQPSRWTTLILAILGAAYLYLIAVYLLGGWQWLAR
jgi:hypothetical protein